MFKKKKKKTSLGLGKWKTSPNFISDALEELVPISVGPAARMPLKLHGSPPRDRI